MTDKEVGELWRSSFYGPVDVQLAHKNITRPLIRKLVEEREAVHTGNGEIAPLHEALKDFGIDPKTF